MRARELGVLWKENSLGIRRRDESLHGSVIMSVYAVDTPSLFYRGFVRAVGQLRI